MNCMTKKSCPFLYATHFGQDFLDISYDFTAQTCARNSELSSNVRTFTRIDLLASNWQWVHWWSWWRCSPTAGCGDPRHRPTYSPRVSIHGHLCSLLGNSLWSSDNMWHIYDSIHQFPYMTTHVVSFVCKIKNVTTAIRDVNNKLTRMAFLQ